MQRRLLAALTLGLATIGCSPPGAGIAAQRDPVISELSVCDLFANKESYLGKKVTLHALLVDATPHGVFFSDHRRPQDSRCIVDIGDMASGHEADLWRAFGSDSLAWAGSGTVEVTAIGTFRTEMREDEAGQRYRSYFLDRLAIVRASGREAEVR